MELHICIRCKGAFWSDEMASEGARKPTYCKPCRTEMARIRTANNPDSYRKYQRDWKRESRLLDPERFRETDTLKHQRDKELRPEKIAARNKVHELTRARSKVSIKQPCEVCSAPAEAHHDDYSKPLEVRWLCPVHHKEADKNVMMGSQKGG